jgi:hypothetical protein
MLKFIIAIIVIAAGVGIFFFLKKEKVETKFWRDKVKQEPALSLEEATSIINNLEKAGYFKYADSNSVDDLKTEMIASMSDYRILSIPETDSTGFPLDYRYYFLDNETLFEQGGVAAQLAFMKPFFNKINLKLNITNHIEKSDTGSNADIDHFITINGKEYIILAAFDGPGWGETAQRFAEILNDQLTMQGIDEQLYLVNAGNDGHAVFLSNKQFNILNEAIKEPSWKPLKPADWCKEFGVDPEKYKKNMNQ